MSVRRPGGLPSPQEIVRERGTRAEATGSRWSARQLASESARWLALSAILLCAWPTQLHAQAAETAPHTRPTAALLATTKASAGDAALDPVLRAALEKLAVVTITAEPAMDLAAMQLALDCVDDTPQCMRVVAEQNGVQVLVAASVQHTADEIVVMLLYFDAPALELRRVRQHQAGAELTQATLDAVPDMLRELFKLEKQADTGTAAEPTGPPPVDEQPASRAPKRGLPVGPLIVAGAGALIVVGGVVSGLMMQKTQDEFSGLQIDSKQAKATADSTASRGKTEATVANVLFGIGAATIAAGGIWLALELTHHDQEEAPRTALLPMVGGGTVGLALVHRGASL
jgi:hypothetical protein